MFVGHYGPSFAIRAGRSAIPLWVLFLAVQLLDVVWSILVLLGVEKVRIVPGITATNPLDLYTCRIPTAWSRPFSGRWQPVSSGGSSLQRAAGRDPAWIGAAVFSHWLLDWIVHRPDLPLYDDTLKSGLGLWNYPALALALEALLLFGGMASYLKRTRASRAIGRFGPPIFGILMLVVQV